MKTAHLCWKLLNDLDWKQEKDPCFFYKKVDTVTWNLSWALNWNNYM
jgi:hypothetical protein